MSFPGITGGTNWGGTATDPRSGYVYVFTKDAGNIGAIAKFPEGGHPITYVNEFSPLLFDSVSGRGGSAGTPGNFAASAQETGGPPITGGPWPCQKPPWGRLNAVNANTGEIAWRVTVGITDELPEGKQNTGRPGVAGPMVTAGGLVFLGSTNNARFRAFDAKTGKELWITKMEYTGNANPMTYRGRNGKQYVAIVAAGTPPAGAPANRQAVMVYALP